MIARVVKTITALGVGQLIHLASQLALPPVLISQYGLEGFAAWLLLSAATSHLSSLDFGLQTYLVNELTLLHQRGQSERMHRLQSVGIRLSIFFFSVGLVIAALVFVFPIARWLGVSDTMDSKTTLFLLAAQILISVIFGQFNGLYRVVGKAARGVSWHNGQRFFVLAGTLASGALAMSFPFIAFVQFAVVAGSLVMLIRALRKEAPDVFPQFGYWSWIDAREILKQSCYFGLFVLNQLLVFQIPIILINRFAGAQAVVVYSIARIVFSFVRQAANLLTAALAPEITRLMGQRDTRGLARTYRSTESIICSVALLGGFGLYLASPALLTFWLRKPELFEPMVFNLMMLASMALLMKDYKLTFQQATNQHVNTALVSCAMYIGMLSAAPQVLRQYSLEGFLVLWLCIEVIQVIVIHQFNVRLLNDREEIDGAVLTKFVGAMASGAIGLWLLEPVLHHGAWGIQSFKALLILAVTLGVCALLFDLRLLARQLRAVFLSIHFPE